MPPKKPTSEAASSGVPPSRRSTRIADQPKVEPSTASSAAVNGGKKGAASKKEPEEITKKRAADSAVNGNGTEDSKKAKPNTASAEDKAEEPVSGDAKKEKATASAKTKITSKKATASAKESAAKKAEKEAEAPADAEPETGPRGQLKKGDKLPKITIKDNTGKEVDVSTLIGEKGAVIFLYPKADTPGCTTQACGYRDNFDKIAEFGYNIYGLSKDKPEAQQKWINKKELTYKLLCDPESKLIKRLGAFVAPNNTKRSHFIFEKGTGKLVDIALGVKPADDPSNVLKFLESHHK